MHALSRCWIGLGANLGNPRKAFSLALESLQSLESTRIVAVSRLFRSEPVDASGPDFINAVAALDTGLPPEVLLAALQRIEREAGRRPSTRNAPRLLDLDLLACGNTVRNDEFLQLPHPRLHQRAFVVMPLAEIAPGLELPGIGPVAAYLDSLRGQRVEPIGHLPGWQAVADSNVSPDVREAAKGTAR